MGRRQINHESMNARFGEGVLERMDRLLEPKEKRADFIRVAVDSEMKRRERRRETRPEVTGPEAGATE